MSSPSLWPCSVQRARINEKNSESVTGQRGRLPPLLLSGLNLAQHRPQGAPAQNMQVIMRHFLTAI